MCTGRTRSSEAIAAAAWLGIQLSERSRCDRVTSMHSNWSTFMTTYKVGYFIGSLSSTSLNRKLATALIELAPDNLSFTEISFKELPLYSPDYDAEYPQVAKAFKNALKAVDAVLFVTPEYNRS